MLSKRPNRNIAAFSHNLLGRIEAERAAYATVLFPVVALTLSTFFEGYRWSWGAVAGVLLTLAGNILVLRQPQKAKTP